MTPKQRQALLQYALAFLGASAVAVTLYVGGIDVANQRPESITVDGETIDFTWTDSHDGEDLLIFTDKRDYEAGFTEETVYVAVVNRSGQRQQIKLTGYFADTNRRIKDVAVLTEATFEESVPIFEEQCTTVEIPGNVASGTPATTEQVCEQVQTGTNPTGQVTRPAWVELPTELKDLAILQEETNLRDQYNITRKSVENFIGEVRTLAFPVDNNRTLYYRFTIDKLPNDQSNFYFEAIGDRGGYGHLDPWFDVSWSYRVKVTVDNTQVSGTSAHTNFPVYIDLSDLPADFHTNVKSDGCDIRVVEADETTETPFELVSYDSVTDTGELHVLVDSLSHNTDTDLWIYYGNSGASCYAVTATYGRNAVWADYESVFHMQDASGTLTDSTGKTGLSVFGSPTFSTVSQIEDGVDYDGGGSQYHSKTTGGPSPVPPVSLQAWFNVDGTSLESIVFIGANNSEHGLIVVGGELWALSQISGNANAETAPGSISTNTWYMGHGVFSGTTNRKVYLNGSLANTNTTSKNPTSGTGVEIGSRYSTTGQDLDGTVDEVRIRKSVLSDSWITTEYNNQSAPGTFYTVGTQESNGGGARRVIIIQ